MLYAPATVELLMVTCGVLDAYGCHFSSLWHRCYAWFCLYCV